MQEMRVRCLGWAGKIPGEGDGSLLHILAGEAPRTEETCGLQSQGSQESDTTE